MRELIKNDVLLCTGCNRCIRVCPAEGANIAYKKENEIKIKVDYNQCIVCGSCIDVCQHGSRDYYDDTEQFLSDLEAGVSISMFAAPANRTNGENWERLLTWLRQKGVKKIYDVSLGADICTWAYIRYIQKETPQSVITQPCPAIVNYILMYNHALLPYLAPIHSPMLCTAIYMKKYENINDKIAALSPCIAKSHEFEATHYVSYNVTLKKLYEYIKKNKIRLPQNETGFDHMESSLGCLYSMPGGLKENVELYIGKTLRIDKSEGQQLVYKVLNEFSKKDEKYLPNIFDVLNCVEGCNLGTGCIHERDIFEINTIMDKERKRVFKSHDKVDFTKMYKEYDRVLKLTDFIREYIPLDTRSYVASNKQIEEAFERLEKKTEADRKINCSACGYDTCLNMAKKIACGLNVPDNCIRKINNDVKIEHNAVLDLSATNLKNLKRILEYISKIRGLSNEIIKSISNVNTTIKQYNDMAKEIDKIAMQINLISLNASIEAARAGQAGKAFGVIAEAIRGLANSSKETVSETGQITKQATDSIKAINVVVDQISAEIENAFQNVTDISEKTESILAKNE